MTHHAATGTVQTVVAAASFITLTVITLCYAWLCWMRPFKRCRTCNGRGQTTTWFLHRCRTCRRCAGEGWRLRHGRRAYNHLRRLHQAAHTAEANAARLKGKRP